MTWGEDEDREDDEEEGSNNDKGKFVVCDITGMANIEKPGIVRKDNGYLEWWNPKTRHGVRSFFSGLFYTNTSQIVQ